MGVSSEERGFLNMTLEDLQKEMTGRGLASYFNATVSMAKNAIGITLKREDRLPVGVSKFGGLPDLPSGTEWCRVAETGMPMSFVAQVNFGETAPFDRDGKLPSRGILYFFYDCSPDGMPWGYAPEHRSGWKVFYYDGDPNRLSPAAPPADLYLDDNGMVFGQAGMVFDARPELPSPESDLANHLNLPDAEETQEACWEWLDDRMEDLSNKLLGHADPIQSAMELECEYVTHNINCGFPNGHRLGKEQGLHKNAARWNLLMQVDSNEDIGMMWGDAGRLYLWITDEDLAERKFENTWLMLQCC